MLFYVLVLCVFLFLLSCLLFFKFRKVEKQTKLELSEFKESITNSIKEQNYLFCKFLDERVTDLQKELSKEKKEVIPDPCERELELEEGLSDKNLNEKQLIL